MAFVINNRRPRTSGPVNAGYAVLEQWTQVSRAAKSLPATTTEILFRIYGGRVLVQAMVGEVTTVIEATDPVAKISYSALNNDSTIKGTAYDIASTLNLSSDEVGTLYGVEGDGTAITSGNQTAGSLEFNGGRQFVLAQGQLYMTTGATKTGALKWDLWYMPLDAGAYVVAIDTATAAIT